MWDRYRACKMLGIPYKIYDMPKAIGGYSELVHRYIHISPKYENDDRVWAHEIAHTLLHFQKIESAAGQDRTLNARAELEADTVAYIVTCALGLENKNYIRYIRRFMRNIPICEIYGTVISKERLTKLKETAILILSSGGYYE